jgi:hypothetical protein
MAARPEPTGRVRSSPRRARRAPRPATVELLELGASHLALAGEVASSGCAATHCVIAAVHCWARVSS